MSEARVAPEPFSGIRKILYLLVAYALIGLLLIWISLVATEAFLCSWDSLYSVLAGLSLNR